MFPGIDMRMFELICEYLADLVLLGRIISLSNDDEVFGWQPII